MERTNVYTIDVKRLLKSPKYVKVLHGSKKLGDVLIGRLGG